MEKFTVVHYGEIGIKGRNRKLFENALVKNIRKIVGGKNYNYVKRIFGRIIIKYDTIKEKYLEEKLRKVFGVAHFSFALSCDQDIDSINRCSLEILKKAKFSSFRVETRRARKDFEFSSQEVNEKVGSFILKNIGNIKVDLENPGAVLFIEIVDKYAFIYVQKIKGLGGLPVSVSGKVVSLISSGIDSPVASFLMMKRGAQVTYVHFHSYPQTSRESIKNVENLVEILNVYQNESKLYLIPFLDIQKKIVEKGYVADRVILYRRMMMRIAQIIVADEKAEALATGESLGQVASQTLTNMNVISEAVDMQILRPLVSYDKQEVVEQAKNIKTYGLSIMPYEDCCSLFVPKSPNTRANINEIKDQEKEMDIKSMEDHAIKSMEKKIIK